MQQAYAPSITHQFLDVTAIALWGEQQIRLVGRPEGLRIEYDADGVSCTLLDEANTADAIQAWLGSPPECRPNPFPIGFAHDGTRQAALDLRGSGEFGWIRIGPHAFPATVDDVAAFHGWLTIYMDLFASHGQKRGQ